jgi:hypothetical protein
VRRHGRCKFVASNVGADREHLLMSFLPANASYFVPPGPSAVAQPVWHEPIASPSAAAFH